MRKVRAALDRQEKGRWFYTKSSSLHMRYMEEMLYSEGGDVLAWNKYVATSVPVWEVVYRRMGLVFCVTFLSSWVCCAGHGAWHTRGMLWQGARREEGGKRALVTSFSSFTRLTNCFRKVKRCLFIHPSYSFSGRDPRMLRWEGRKL